MLLIIFTKIGIVFQRSNIPLFSRHFKSNFVKFEKSKLQFRTIPFAIWLRYVKTQKIFQETIVRDWERRTFASFTYLL